MRDCVHWVDCGHVYSVVLIGVGRPNPARLLWGSWLCKNGEVELSAGKQVSMCIRFFLLLTVCVLRLAALDFPQ